MFAHCPSHFLINHDVSEAVSLSFFRQGESELLDPLDLLCLITQCYVLGTTVSYSQSLSYTRRPNEPTNIITLTQTFARYRFHAIKVH
jgi:hypothetical protein